MVHEGDCLVFVDWIPFNHINVWTSILLSPDMLMVFDLMVHFHSRRRSPTKMCHNDFLWNADTDWLYPNKFQPDSKRLDEVKHLYPVHNFVESQSVLLFFQHVFWVRWTKLIWLFLEFHDLWKKRLAQESILTGNSLRDRLDSSFPIQSTGYWIASCCLR